MAGHLGIRQDRSRDVEAAEIDESAPAPILLDPNKRVTRGKR